MALIGEFVSKVKKKMPLEALLFFMHHIWISVIGLTMIVVIGTGIQYGLHTYILVMTLGLFVLFFVPITAIVQNILKNMKDARRVWCCIPLLIVGIIQTMAIIIGHAKVMVYETHPDSLIYALMFPIQRFAQIAIDPMIEYVFYMGFPYNQLPQIIFSIVFLPLSLFIYLLPSIDYDRMKITKEMKLIAVLPSFCIVIPVIIQTIKMSLGLIDEIMIKYFWFEITSNILRMSFLLMPILGILYITHYRRFRLTSF